MCACRDCPVFLTLQQLGRHRVTRAAPGVLLQQPSRSNSRSTSPGQCPLLSRPHQLLLRLQVGGTAVPVVVQLYSTACMGTAGRFAVTQYMTLLQGSLSSRGNMHCQDTCVVPPKTSWSAILLV